MARNDFVAPVAAPEGRPSNYHFSGLHGAYHIYITGHEFPQLHLWLESLVKLPAVQTRIPGSWGGRKHKKKTSTIEYRG
jgi:hypothetical protein